MHHKLSTSIAHFCKHEYNLVEFSLCEPNSNNKKNVEHVNKFRRQVLASPEVNKNFELLGKSASFFPLCIKKSRRNTTLNPGYSQCHVNP